MLNLEKTAILKSNPSSVIYETNKNNLIKEKTFILTKIKKHKQWSLEEDKLLIKLAVLFKQKSWTKISKDFEDKTPAQCRARYKRIRPGIVKGSWSKEEDQLIRSHVEKNGKNWALISKLMKTRNGKQIRDRFLNYLDPEIKKEKFEDEEDHKIVSLYKDYGPKWSIISKHFEGRTGDMIKNRFHSCLKRKVHINEIIKSKRQIKKSSRLKNYKKKISSKIEFKISNNIVELTSLNKNNLEENPLVSYFEKDYSEKNIFYPSTEETWKDKKIGFPDKLIIDKKDNFEINFSNLQIEKPIKKISLFKPMNYKNKIDFKLNNFLNKKRIRIFKKIQNTKNEKNYINQVSSRINLNKNGIIKNFKIKNENYFKNKINKKKIFNDSIIRSRSKNYNFNKNNIKTSSINAHNLNYSTFNSTKLPFGKKDLYFKEENLKNYFSQRNISKKKYKKKIISEKTSKKYEKMENKKIQEDFYSDLLFYFFIYDIKNFAIENILKNFNCLSIKTHKEYFSYMRNFVIYLYSSLKLKINNNNNKCYENNICIKNINDKICELINYITETNYEKIQLYISYVFLFNSTYESQTKFYYNINNFYKLFLNNINKSIKNAFEFDNHISKFK